MHFGITNGTASNPCGQVPEDCYDRYGDPCPCANDGSRNCQEDTNPDDDGDENGDEGVILDPNDPWISVFCFKIQKQLENPAFSQNINELKNNTSLEHETGFSESTDGSFNELDVSVNGHNVDIPLGGHTLGAMHTHTNDYESGENDKNGNPRIYKITRMFSPQDILSFLKLVLIAKNKGRPIQDIYLIMVSISGTYQILFNGDTSNININFNPNDYKKIYLKYMKMGKEKGFLKFLKEELGQEGIRFFKMKNNGSIKEKYLNENGKLRSRTCD